MQETRPARIRLGAFEFDPRAGELHHEGQSVILQEQQLKVLLMLIEREGEIATREEIKKRLWPNDTIVEFDHGINNTIKNLRRALGDSADSPKYIETVARRGYRLMVPVEWVSSSGDSSDDVSFRAERSAVEKPPVGNADALPIAKPKVGRLTGKVVSHYRVLEVIGGGGMGLVYRAEDLKLGRAVALKFLPEEVGDDPKARERFEREAHAVSALDHPNICTVYDFDEHKGHPFIAMQLLQGKTLRDHLADGRFRLSQPEGLEVAIQIAAGLEAAHEKGIIHRDVKPANIFITEKNVAKILDFGVAKVIQLTESPNPVILRDEAEQSEAEESKDSYGYEKGRGFSRAAAASLQDQRGDQSPAGLIPAQSSDDNANCTPEGVLHPGTTLTRTGMKLGTAGYMSPEQIRGEPLDARTDIFSFGLVLYEMATGERAFTGDTEAIVSDAIVNKTPLPVHEANPQISPRLEALIDRALEKERERRYQTMAELLADLEGVRSKPTRPARAKGKWYAVAVLILVSVASAGLLYLRSRKHIRFTDRDTIVVAHLQNVTGDTVMGDALDWPLSRELQESPYLTVLYSAKVRDVLKLLKASSVRETPAGPELSPELARDVCMRTDSRAFVTPVIANVGNYYQITLDARDCHSGKTLATVERETTARNEIVKTLGAAGHQLRRELGEPEDSLKTFNTPLENETSWSLEALQAFTQAWRLRAEQGNAALPEFKRAVELDPNFAMSYVNIASIFRNLRDTSSVMKYAAKGFALGKRLSQRSRWFIQAVYYLIATGELEKANATFIQWMQIFPADPTPHLNFAVSLSGLGQYERAAAEAHEGIRLTFGHPFYDNLAEPLVAMNRLEEAKAVFQEAKAYEVDNDNLPLRWCRYSVAFLEHDTAGMQEQLSWAMAKPETSEWAIGLQVGAASYSGRLRAARGLYSLARKYSTDAHTPLLNQNAFAYMALADLETGAFIRARQEAESAGIRDPTSSTRRLVALVLARAGGVGEIDRMATEIDQEFPLDTLVQRYELPTIRAAIELTKNHPAQAIEILQPVVPYDLVSPNDSFPKLYSAYVRGLAYLELGKGREAAAEFQKMTDHPGIVEDAITAPLSHLYLARAQAMMGDKDATRKSYQDFLTLWKDADPDIPIYQQAKAEYAKLTKSSQLSAVSHQ